MGININNDQALRAAIDSLPLADQRVLGAKFVESVVLLCQEPVVREALETAQNPQIDPTALSALYNRVKSLAVQTYTNCGDETDWSEQAAHFVAVATRLCLSPERHLGQKQNLAWKCAIQSRLAKYCDMIDSGMVDSEAKKQYAIAEEFLREKHVSAAQ